MRYIPTIIANKWITNTTSGNGNKGINNQEQFKSGVVMLEYAIEHYGSPRLIHTVLTDGDNATYDQFIQKFKRDLKVAYQYKGCTESETRKGHHRHFMWIVDTDSPAAIFDQSNPSSTISRVMASMPEGFKVEVCRPKRHPGSISIPLSPATLQDAADWLSYIFKARSKSAGHSYMSSRATRRPVQVCNDRDMGLGLAVRAVDRVLYKNNTYRLRPVGTPTQQRLQRPVLGGLPRPANWFTLGIRQLHQQIRPQNAFVNHLK